MTFDRRIDPSPHAPRGLGLLGEIDAMHAIVTVAGARVQPAMLVGVSGLAFSYGFSVSTDTRGALPQFGWFRPSQLDGPAPLRLAARFAGFDYTPHLVNGASTMFERVVGSIDAGLPVLTHDPRAPHGPAIIFGYSSDGEPPKFDPPRSYRMLCSVPFDVEDEADGEGPITVTLASDPDAVMLELGPWRNPMGVIQRSSRPMDDERAGREIRSALRRAAATSETSVIAAPAGDEAMPDGDVLDSGVRDIMVRPSFDSWARTVLGEELDLLALGSALDDLIRARRAAGDFLRVGAGYSGWATEPVGEFYDRIADGLTNCRAMIPADGTGLDDVARDAMAARLHELHGVETEAMAALRDTFK